jgi:hypothetical protein
MKPIKLFFAKIRRMYFNWRVNREIFHRISPHLHDEGNYGYPFRSKDELVAACIRGGLDAHFKFDMIERVIRDMPEFQGNAFRYIIYRDLNERIKMYIELAAESAKPESTVGRLMAKHA